MSLWKPKEIIVHQKAAEDELTGKIVTRCPDVPVRLVESGRGTDVAKASRLLQKEKRSMLQTVLTGKNVLFVSVPGQDTVDIFQQTDERIVNLENKEGIMTERKTEDSFHWSAPQNLIWNFLEKLES